MDLLTVQARGDGNRSVVLEAVQAVAAMAFGAVALLLPGMTLDVLLFLFGAFAVFSGVAMVIGAIGSGAGIRAYWPQLVAGLAAAGLGGISLLLPGITAVALLYLIAGWAILVGVADIIGAFRPADGTAEQRWPLALSGVLALALGAVLLIVRPGEGILALIWLIGAYAAIAGLVKAYGALRLSRRQSA